MLHDQKPESKESVLMFSVLLPGNIHLWPKQLGDQSNLHSIPSPTCGHWESCWVQKVLPQWNPVLCTGYSSSPGDQTMLADFPMMGNLDFTLSL